MAEKVRETLKNKGLIGDSVASSASKAQPISENVLLAGFGFYLDRINGDKNFWLGLSKELSFKLDKMVIVSINSSPVKFEQEGNIYLYNVPPPFHRKKDGDGKSGSQFLKHFPPWKVVERSVILLRLIPFLKKIANLHNIQVIHLMDNFGFLTGLIKVVFPKLQVYATAITYNVHGYPPRLYSFYQRMILGNIDEVAVSSQAYREKLIEHGFSREKVKVIRWGVAISDRKERPQKKEGKNPSTKVILWTGFTQQIKTKSFYLSLSLAQRLIRKKSAVDFIFAFKPECFHKKYGLFQEEHIQVITTSPQDFQKLLGKVDLLLAPLEDSKSAVAPPLTWIECMTLGIPIITTQALGVDEVIQHNESGFVAKSNGELEGLIEKILKEEDLLSKVSGKAQELVETEYNLSDIAHDYLRLWREDGRVILSS